MSTPPKVRADETVSVRLPSGTAAKIRAATGQPFSRLVRWTMLALLEKHKDAAALSDGANELRDIVNGDDRL